MESGQVDFRWLGEVDQALNSGIEEDAVQIWVGVCDAKIDGCQGLGDTVS